MDVIPTIRTPREKPAREIYEQYLQSGSWRITRNHALRRAGYQCQRCPAKRNLQVHHLTYERLGREWDGDLEVVCDHCHDGIHLAEMRGNDHGKLHLKLANDAIRDNPCVASIADLADIVKTRCASLRIPYEGYQIDKALGLLTGQRRTSFVEPKREIQDSPQYPPLSRHEAARIWAELTEQGLPLEQLKAKQDEDMKKWVQERRQKLRDLAEQDYASRCRHCHKRLESVRLQMGEVFCSTECIDAEALFQQHWQAARARVEGKKS